MGSGASEPQNVERSQKATKFTHQQIEMFSEMFYSAFPNKKVTRKDFDKILTLYFPGYNISGISKHLFRAFTKTQYIDFHDFIKVYSAIINKEDIHLQQIIFSFYDADNDDYLTKKDVLTVSDDLFKEVVKESGFNVGLDYESIIDEWFVSINKPRINFKEFQEFYNHPTDEFTTIFKFLENY